MTPQQAVHSLVDSGMSHQDIVAALSLGGVKTTQPTVSRIGAGVSKTTSYELGQALVRLAEQKSNSISREDATDAA